MRSRTSFFDKRFSLYLLRRFWPLWALWMSVLLLAGPVNLATVYDETPARYISYLRHELLDSAGGVVFFAVAAGALMAMAVLSYLYDSRVCGLFASLPLRRETAYCTAVFTGIAPMLLCDALVSLVLLLMLRGKGVETRSCLEWLGAAAFANAGFYGFACFCGLLTGNLFVLPAVYGVLLCAVPVAEAFVRELFSALLYGYAGGQVYTEWLSPPIWLLDNFCVDPIVLPDVEAGKVGVYTLFGLGYLAAFAAVGLALALLGTLILRRRHMEAAGEVVAVPVLRPIFRVCMTLGGGLLGAVLFLEVFTYNMRGAPRFVLLMILLCVFAALGYFIAQMLLQKTLRVFGRGWKELGVLCACLVCFAALIELDVLGYETRLPEADEIESIDVDNRFPGDGARRPETIAAFLDFHRGVIAHKAENEAATGYYREQLSLCYHLKNGETFTRRYRLAGDEDSRADPDSDIRAWERLMNLHELRMLRVRADRPLSADQINKAWIEVETRTEYGNRISERVPITAEQAISLYNEGVLPDAEAGRIGQYHTWDSAEAESARTNLSFAASLKGDDAWSYIGVPVQLTSELTLQWLKENMGLEPR